MNDAVVIDAPPTQDAAPSFEGGLDAAMKAEVQFREGDKRDTQHAEQKPPKQEAPADKKAEEAPKADKPAGDKPKPWDRLAKPPEVEKKAEDTADALEADDLPDDAPKAQNAWTKAKKELKERRAQAAQWEAEKQAWEAEKKTLVEKASKVTDEDLTELQRFREEQAIYDVKRTKTYQERAQTPWNEGEATLGEVSEYTKISPDKLKEALLEPNRLARLDLVTELLRTSERTIDDARIGALANQVLEAGQKLHAAHLAHKELTEEAAVKGKQRATMEEASKIKAQTEAKEIHQRGMKEMRTNLEQVQLKDLIEEGLLDPKEFDAVEGIEMPDDPMDRIYMLHTSMLLPAIAQALRQERAKNKQYEADRQARLGARPSTKPGSPNQGAKREISLDEAMKAQMQHQGH
jgi:hypothetical protein